MCICVCLDNDENVFHVYENVFHVYVVFSDENIFHVCFLDNDENAMCIRVS